MVQALSDVIREQLKQKAKSDNLIPDTYFLRWITEGFLRRLAYSPYVDRFALKGGNMFVPWNSDWRRTTRDVDLEGLFDEDADHVTDIIRQICEVQLPVDDGVIFDLNTFEERALHSGALGDGRRITLRPNIGGCKVYLRIDVTFGRPISLAPSLYRFPSILPHGEKAEILGVTRESAIADRLALMIEFGSDNTRLKDYSDIWSLTTTSTFVASRLTWAIATAFFNRDAQKLIESQDEAWVSGFADEFVSPSAIRLWNSWLDRQSFLSRPTLPDVVRRVREFAMPVLLAIRDRRPFNEHWDPQLHWHPRISSPRRRHKRETVTIGSAAPKPRRPSRRLALR